MPKLTSIYRLPYLSSGEVLTGPIDRTRFMAIDRQLEAIFTFLGDGVISGWEIVKDNDNLKKIRVTRGSGVISSIAASTSSDYLMESPTLPTDSSLLRNNVYMKVLGKTPYTAQGELIITTETFSFDVYLPLGYITVDKNGNIAEINMTEESGRKSLELIRFISSLIEDHVHTGAPGEPDKIDLFNHVKGVLSAANIEDLPASKITSGIIPKDRFSLSHNDLSDIGTLTHEEIDSLVEKLQTLNRLLFGDIMTANLIQLILSMKHVFSNIDDYMFNFAAIIPGIGNSELLNPKSFIDINATTAELDFESHLIKGKFVNSRDLGQYTFNSEQEFKEGEYNPIFITITGNLDSDQAYGYGYGYGNGLDYFDVIYTNFKDTFSLDEEVFDYDGSLSGHGISDGFDNNFELVYENSYGYGYGFEYGFGFNGTGNAIIFLNPLGADQLVHSKDDGDLYSDLLDTTDRATSYPLLSATTSPSYIDSKKLISFGSQAASLYDGIVSGKKRRSSNVSSSTTPDSTSMYSYTSILSVKDGNITRIESDKSIMFAVWEDLYDVSENMFLNFLLKQTNSSDAILDPNWTYDYDMDLIIEVTNPSYSEYPARYYYRYIGDSSVPSTYRFFGRGDDEPFQSNDLDENGVPTVTISAELVSSKMEFLFGYVDDTSLEFTVTTPPSTALTDPGWDVLKVGVTGIYLLTSRDDGYDVIQNQAKPLSWPQGSRSQLEVIDSIELSEMLVDINNVYFSGSFEYSSNIDNNKLENLTIDFPDPISIESISWVSTEPGDSAIYLQIKKNASIIVGADAGESDYRENLFFTKKSSEFMEGGVYSSLFVQEFGPDSGDLLRTYLSSGESLPEVFSQIYSTSYGISIRVVLLPTSDNKATPVLNSLTINYSTETTSGSLTISAQDDFDSYRSIENTKITSGEVSILETSRTGNIIYGSNKKVTELKSTFNEKYTNNYTGSNLPKTALQILNEESSGLVGDITDLKIMSSGNIMFLDRDSSRIIEIDTNRDIVNMYVSEFAFNRVYEADPSIPASLEGKVVNVVFNRQLGDNGVLYVIFSHEISSWFDGVITPNDTSVESDINVIPENFNIRYKGLSRNLSDSESIYAVDRGVLAFFVSAETGNWIESISSPILDVNFHPDSETLIPTASSIVKFENSEVPVEDLNGANQRINILKIGNKGSVTNSYNLMFLPIQGTVAFNIDEYGYMYILKKARPYSWDDSIFESWYMKINPREAYKSSSLSKIESNSNFPQGSFGFENESNPSFETNSFFGIKGSIEKKGEFLLISLTGEKNNGLYVFRKNSTTSTYDLPTQISLDDDGTYPMDARFDPKTFENTDYGDIYVALSDLKRGVAGADSISRFEKIKPDGTKNWEWGRETSDASVKFSIGANSVRPLFTSSFDGLVFST